MNTSHARFAHTAMSIREQIIALQIKIPVLRARHTEVAVNPTVGNELVNDLSGTLLTALDLTEQIIESL